MDQELPPELLRETMEHIHDGIPAVFDVPTLLIVIGMLQLALKHPANAIPDPDPDPLSPPVIVRRVIDTFIGQLREIGMPVTADFYEAAGHEEEEPLVKLA